MCECVKTSYVSIHSYSQLDGQATLKINCGIPEVSLFCYKNPADPNFRLCKISAHPISRLCKIPADPISRLWKISADPIFRLCKVHANTIFRLCKIPTDTISGDRASYPRAWSANDLSIFEALHLGRAPDSFQVSSKFILKTCNIDHTQSLYIIPSQ